MTTEAAEAANPSQEEAQGQTFEAGSEEAALHALAKRESEAEEAPETQTDEPESEATEEPGDGEPEEAEDKGELVNVEYEGKQYQLPPELREAVLRRSDYSRYMGEVKAKEKDVTQRAEAADSLIKGAETYAKALAEVSGLEDQIKQFESVDFDALELSDPSRAAILALKLMRLQAARDKAIEGSKSIDAKLKTEQAQAIDAKRADMVKALAKDLPGWGDELGTKITQYAISKGYSVQDIASITDPRTVIALDKARRYDALQSGKSVAQAKAKDAPPVAKPGAKRVANPANDAMTRFNRSKSDDDAIAALESRSRR